MSSCCHAIHRHQTIAQDGLASVACESKSARVLAGASIVMDALTLYLVLSEVRIVSRASFDGVFEARMPNTTRSFFLTLILGCTGVSRILILPVMQSPQP